MSVPTAPVPPGEGTASGSASSGAVQPAILRAAEHLAAGRPAEAARALGALVAGAPTYAAAHVLHATALEAAGQPVEALAAWHRAAFLVPRSPLVQRERLRLMGVAAESVPVTAIEPPPVEPPFAEVPAVEAPVEQAPAEAAPIEAAPIEAAPAEVRLEEPVRDEAPSTASIETPTEAQTIEVPDAPLGATLPLDDLLSFNHAETGTPLFVDEDEPDEATVAPPAEASAAFDFEPNAEPDPTTAPPLADWADDEPTGGVRLMSPEGDGESVPEPIDEDDDWAVVEEFGADEPEPGESFGDAAFSFDEPTVEPVIEPGVEWPTASGESPAVEAPIAEAPEVPSVVDELDSLIASLEDAPRIRPDPTFNGPPVAVKMAGVDEMASETLAKIYAAQHQYVEAALVYEKLAARDPDRADAMLAQAAEMRRRRS